MKYAAVVLALAASVFGQASLADLPTCSITCLTTAVSSSGCGVTDYSCQCGSKKDAITAAVTPCLQKACSADDQAKVLSITAEICASVGGSSSAIGSATSAIGSAASSASAALSSAASSASGAASQSSSAAGGRLGAAGALVAAAGILVL